MIQKQSLLTTIDKTGVLLINTFHLYKGFFRKKSFIGDFIKISVRTVKVDSFLKKKTKSLALITNSNYKVIKLDSSTIYFKENSCILLKKKLILRSKEVIFPTSYKINRKKLFYKFTGVI